MPVELYTEPETEEAVELDDLALLIYGEDIDVNEDTDVVPVTSSKHAHMDTWKDIGSAPFFLPTTITTSLTSGCCGKRTTFCGFSFCKNNAFEKTLAVI